jgi:hypothetical protein
MLCSFLRRVALVIRLADGFGQRPTSNKKQPLSGSANGWLLAKVYPFAVLANRNPTDTATN